MYIPWEPINIQNDNLTECEIPKYSRDRGPRRYKGRVDVYPTSPVNGQALEIIRELYLIYFLFL